MSTVNELNDRALLSLEEARLFVFRNAGDSTRDEALIAAINDVSDSIESYCAREFAPSTGATVLDGAIDDNDVALTVADWRSLPTSGSFMVRVDDEIMLVTAGAGTATLTVTRGYLDTTAASHLDGAELVELEARDYPYKGTGVLSLEPHDLLELHTVTLYTDLDEAQQDELESTAYRLVRAPMGGTYESIRVPYPALEEAAYGFGWQATVVGRWGMLEVPGDVRLAAKIWVENLVKNPAGASSTTMAGYTFTPELETELGRRAGMPPSARYRLEPWRRAGAGQQTKGVVRFTNAGAGSPPAIPNTLPTP